MYSISQIYVETPAEVVKRSFNVRISSIAQSSENEFVCNAQDLDGKRKVIVRGFPNGKIWIHCNCPWFQYVCEVVLTLKGSSSIIKSNGKMPKETNPLMKPWVCKHGIAFIRELLKQKKLFI